MAAQVLDRVCGVRRRNSFGRDNERSYEPDGPICAVHGNVQSTVLFTHPAHLGVLIVITHRFFAICLVCADRFHFDVDPQAPGLIRPALSSFDAHIPGSKTSSTSYSSNDGTSTTVLPR